SEGFFTQLVPALIKFALILIGPLLGNVVRSVRGTGSEVNEERLVGSQGLLLRDPSARLVGHVFDKVITFFGRLLWLNGSCSFIQRWVPLIGLPSNEAVEIFKATAAGGPCVEGTDGARLPHGNFMALSELSSGVAVELQCSR